MSDTRLCEEPDIWLLGEPNTWLCGEPDIRIRDLKLSIPALINSLGRSDFLTPGKSAPRDPLEHRAELAIGGAHLLADALTVLLLLG